MLEEPQIFTRTLKDFLDEGDPMPARIIPSPENITL
jgi:hypothetical protein